MVAYLLWTSHVYLGATQTLRSDTIQTCGRRISRTGRLHWAALTEDFVYAYAHVYGVVEWSTIDLRSFIRWYQCIPLV